MKKLVSSTGCAAFGTDSHGTIVVWNEAAEDLLGHLAQEVVGRPCHDVVCGQDIFGNRYCHGECSVQSMAKRGEPVNPFEMDVRHSTGRHVRAGFCTLVLDVQDDPNVRIIHLLQPASTTTAGEALEDSGAAPVGEAMAESGGNNGRDGNDVPLLTPREMEVLALLNQGEPTRAISRTLSISVTTVRNHIQGILRKLGAHSRLEAVSIARRQSLL